FPFARSRSFAARSRTALADQRRLRSRFTSGVSPKVCFERGLLDHSYPRSSPEASTLTRAHRSRVLPPYARPSAEGFGKSGREISRDNTMRDRRSRDAVALGRARRLGAGMSYLCCS